MKPIISDYLKFFRHNELTQTRAGSLWRYFFKAVVSLALAGCANQGPSKIGDHSCPLEQEATTEITMHGNVPVITVAINGQPATMLLDTGTAFTLLKTSAVNRLGVGLDFKNCGMAQGIGQAMPIVSVPIRKLELGGYALRGNAMMVGNAVGIPSGIDGLLGSDLLSKFDVDLDMPHLTLSLYKPRACETPPPWQRSFFLLKGRQFENKIIVPLELNGVELKAVFDSGSSIPLLVSENAARRVGATAEILS